MNKKDLKNLRTYRNIIHIKDLILPYINFKSSEFQNYMKNLNLFP